MALLDHENLDVYPRSIDFLALALALALRVVARLPRGERDLRDQLKRAAMSIPLNIAEGAGKPTVADRARFHAIARGSAISTSAESPAWSRPRTQATARRSWPESSRCSLRCVDPDR